MLQKYSRTGQATLLALIQYNDKKYITLTKISEINYYLQSNLGSTLKQAKKSFLS